LYNFPSFASFSSLSLLNYASLLLAFFLNWSKALIASFWCDKKYK
jgi:hypothetical protein